MNDSNLLQEIMETYNYCFQILNKQLKISVCATSLPEVPAWVITSDMVAKHGSCN